MTLLSGLGVAAAALTWMRHVQPQDDRDEIDAMTLIVGDQVQPNIGFPKKGIEAPWNASDIQGVMINNTLDRFHDAAAKADFDAYFSVWTHESVFLGTD